TRASGSVSVRGPECVVVVGGEEVAEDAGRRLVVGEGGELDAAAAIAHGERREWDLGGIRPRDDRARHDLGALPRQTISPETDRDEREGDDLERCHRDEHPLAEVRAATLQQLTVLEAAPAAEFDP